MKCILQNNCWQQQQQWEKYRIAWKAHEIIKNEDGVEQIIIKTGNQTKQELL